MHHLSKYCWFLFFCWFTACTQPTSTSENSTPSSQPPAVTTTTVSKIEDMPKPTHDERFSDDYLTGKIDPTTHPDFIRIRSEHASNDAMYLRQDAYEAFVQMYAAAKAEGISMKIISATRPFHHQKRIWEAKWTGKRLVEGKDLSKTIVDPSQRALKILEYSSMPGTSRHHWGTDIDINNLENHYFESGEGLKLYQWMLANASLYGFCQPYTAKGAERPNGYEEEKWHWSYTPVAKVLAQQYKLRLANEGITGFEGAATAPQINVIQNYVLGINTDCL